jgi:uncharacterized glyoxalase superfamily protein PhnB
MATINVHINFNGNAEESFMFYRSVFGGEFSKVLRFKDVASLEFPVPKNEEDKIMLIALPIGSNTLIANDVPEIMGRTNENEDRSKISVCTKAGMKPTHYLMGYLKAERSKCQWVIARGAHTSECFETNLVLNGS